MFREKKSSYHVDIILLDNITENDGKISWEFGQVHMVGEYSQDVSRKILGITNASKADFLLFWAFNFELIDKRTIIEIIDSGADITHAGLKIGYGEIFKELNLVIHDWSMINGQENSKTYNWRTSLQACLINREIFNGLGGIDNSFADFTTAGLDLGYRGFLQGAIVEYQPNLMPVKKQIELQVCLKDKYYFIAKHWGIRWAKYMYYRRILKDLRCWREKKYISLTKELINSVTDKKATFDNLKNSFTANRKLENTKKNPTVSVIIPTLGRYDYLPQAIESLEKQTIKPVEIIVVDQNHPKERQPQLYKKYNSINLQIIWQDQRGQSLARNTGLKHVNSEYVLLFDDDSIADENMIKNHLIPVLDGNYQISTGISFPPPPNDYKLPDHFKYPRLSTTFDTGNSLIPIDILKKVSGFDGNYNYGPGTDLDLGTRLYLNGYRILHNPSAIRIHYKAPSGGLRVYGAHKYNTDLKLLHPFPPVTQYYYGLRYLNRNQLFERIILQFITSKFPNKKNRMHSMKSSIMFKLILSIIFLPWKIYLSRKKAKLLLFQNGVLLHRFSDN